jgi:hypothetical protein
MTDVEFMRLRKIGAVVVETTSQRRQSPYRSWKDISAEYKSDGGTPEVPKASVYALGALVVC